jgi:hypothetical protein
MIHCESLLSYAIREIKCEKFTLSCTFQFLVKKNYKHFKTHSNFTFKCSDFTSLLYKLVTFTRLHSFNLLHSSI